MFFYVRDETLLVSATQDGEIFLWKLDDSYSLQATAKGEFIQAKNFIKTCHVNTKLLCAEHNTKINAITFEPDSKNVISCANNKSLSVMDVQTSTQTYTTTLEEEPVSLAWIYSFLLIGDLRGDLLMWDPQTAAFISKFHCHQGNRKFNPITSSSYRIKAI